MLATFIDCSALTSSKTSLLNSPTNTYAYQLFWNLRCLYFDLLKMITLVRYQQLSGLRPFWDVKTKVWRWDSHRNTVVVHRSRLTWFLHFHKEFSYYWSVWEKAQAITVDGKHEHWRKKICRHGAFTLVSCRQNTQSIQNGTQIP